MATGAPSSYRALSTSGPSNEAPVADAGGLGAARFLPAAPICVASKTPTWIRLSRSFVGKVKWIRFMPVSSFSQPINFPTMAVLELRSTSCSFTSVPSMVQRTTRNAPARGAWTPPPGLRPVALHAHGEPLNACMLACNLTEVARTGVDPCTAASIPDGGAVDPSLKDVHANYSCYYGGEGWLHPPDLGVCAFNCSARQPDGATCDDDDIINDKCDIYCDSRTLPAPSRAGSGGVPVRGGGRVGRGAKIALARR